MQSALALFAKNGYHATSVADIIREIGVARGTYYRYFDDKQDLFYQLLETNFKFVRKVMPQIPENPDIKAEDLEAILTTAFRRLLNQPDSLAFVSMMVNEASGVDKASAKMVSAFYDDLAEVFAGYISKVQAEGLIKSLDPRISAYLVLGALKEIFIQWSGGDKFTDLEDLIHQVVSFIVHGIKN